MSIDKIQEYLTKLTGEECLVSDKGDHFEMRIPAMKGFEMTFGKVSNFRELGALSQMIKDGIASYKVELAEYIETKTQKRGPYKKRKP